jgi:phosphoribosylanthranilate isomerase
MGAHYLGFNFQVNHENYVTPDTFLEIKSWISGPEFVGEFENAEISYIREIPNLGEMDLIEINQPEKLNDLTLFGKPIILKLDLSRYPSIPSLEEDLNFSRDMVDFFLIERSARRSLDLDLILRLSHQYPILLGFGMNKKNIHQILGNSAIKGIALQGGKEEKVGFKDYEVLANILEELETE